MKGRNSLGRRISLLNDDEYDPCFKLNSQPYFNSLSPHIQKLSAPIYSRAPSFESYRSPPTPCLTGSDSSECDTHSPSPITPNSSIFNPLPSGSSHIPPFSLSIPAFTVVQSTDHRNQFCQTFVGSCTYSPIKQPSAPNPQLLSNNPIVNESHDHKQSRSPISTSFKSNTHLSPHSPPVVHPPAPAKKQRSASNLSVQTASSSTGTESRRTHPTKSKKNTYPCPLARQYNCNDYFTTSGHAARHSKKHTGRKDAICPQCSKAFTRKDNMEQHRRTHKEGRATKSPLGEQSEIKRRRSDSGSVSSNASAQDNATKPKVTNTSSNIHTTLGHTNNTIKSTVSFSNSTNSTASPISSNSITSSLSFTSITPSRRQLALPRSNSLVAVSNPDRVPTSLSLTQTQPPHILTRHAATLDTLGQAAVLASTAAARPRSVRS